MSNEQLNGATVIPEWQRPATDAVPECMGRWKHAWKWLWLGGVWTNKMYCPTCGAQRDEKAGQ